MKATYDVIGLSWRSVVVAAGLAVVTSATAFFFLDVAFWAFAFVLMPVVCVGVMTALSVMMDRHLDIESEVHISRRHATVIPYISLFGFTLFVAIAVVTGDVERWLPGSMVIVSVSIGSDLGRIAMLQRRAKEERNQR